MMKKGVTKLGDKQVNLCILPIHVYLITYFKTLCLCFYGENKCVVVYRQMTEFTKPPGAHAHFGLTGLIVAEGQDIFLFIDNDFHFT